MAEQWGSVRRDITRPVSFARRRIADARAASSTTAIAMTLAAEKVARGWLGSGAIILADILGVELAAETLYRMADHFATATKQDDDAVIAIALGDIEPPDEKEDGEDA